MQTQELYTKFLKHPLICTDSRKVEKDTLFFALKGENFNGNLFAEKALSDGCAYAIVDEDLHIKSDKIVRVNNVLESLQQLANYHRRVLKTPIIALTGSNGKTTTKELLIQILGAKFNVYGTEGNLNNHIGVPLTLLKLKPEHDYGVIEMGANHQGEINALCEIAEPDFGLITNIGKAHLEGFGGFKGVRKGKTEMYRFINSRSGTIFYNHSNPILLEEAQKLEKSKHIAYSVEGVGFTGHVGEKSTLLTGELCTEKGIAQPFKSQLAGDYNLENIVASAAVGDYLGVNLKDIANAIETYVPSNMRSQIIETSRNTILLDAYNANPSSMHASVKEFVKQESKRDKVIFLGSMKEMGKYSFEEHTFLVRKVEPYDNIEVVLIGEEYSGISCSLASYKSVNELIEQRDLSELSDKYILIKGSRANKLEKLIDLL
jgi:UDP-N-acetylmuramoyl-tripeptide--D-alanyl-D-alanine ligase